MDTYDLASDARDREISHILTDRDRGKLEAIDEALARVDDGSYGSARTAAPRSPKVASRRCRSPASASPASPIASASHA